MSVSFATALTGALITSFAATLAFGSNIQTHNTLGLTVTPSQQDSSQDLAHRGSGRFDPLMDSASARAANV